MPWQPPAPTAPEPLDARLDPFRGREATVSAGGRRIGRLRLHAVTYWPSTGGHLWWRRWGPQSEGVRVVLVHDRGGTEEWTSCGEALEADLADWAQGRLRRAPAVYRLQWLEPGAARSLVAGAEREVS